MPALAAVVLNPVTVTMLVVCFAGVIFMIRFLIALLADERKFRARYLIRFEQSEQTRSASTSDEHRYTGEVRRKKLPTAADSFPSFHARIRTRR
jgi:hypothetical protein